MPDDPADEQADERERIAKALEEVPATTGDAIFAAEVLKDLILLLVDGGVLTRAAAADLIGHRLQAVLRRRRTFPGHPLAFEQLTAHLEELAEDIRRTPGALPRR